MSMSAFFILQHKAGLQHVVMRVLVSPAGPGCLAADGPGSHQLSQQPDEGSRRPRPQRPDCGSAQCWQPRSQLRSIFCCHSLAETNPLQVTHVQWFSKVSCILCETDDIQTFCLRRRRKGLTTDLASLF